MNFYIAEAYGQGLYNANTYSNQSTTAEAPASTAAGTGGAGLLTNTGFDVLLAVTLACAIIFTALVIRFWRRPKRQPE